MAETVHASPIPRVADGQGIKAGERSTFHPGAALTFGFDDNVFYTHRSEAVDRAGFMTVSGWAGIGNREVRDGTLMTPAERSGRWLDYNIATMLGFRQYLTRDETIRKQSRFSADVAAHLALLPGRRFSVMLDEDFQRLAEPRNYEAGGGYNFNRIVQDATLTLVARPGGGRLELDAAYVSKLLWFEDTDFEVDRNNRILNGARTQLRWRFLPRSALLFRYEMGHTYYLSCCQAIGFGRNEDNFAHRIEGGYRGQVLRKVVLEVVGGLGLAYYRNDVDGPNFRGWLARVAIDYFPTLRTRIHTSFERQFSDSLFGNYFVDLVGRVNVRHTFRWRMLATLGFEVVGREYFGLPRPQVDDLAIASYENTSGGGREDLVMTGQAKLEQSIGRFVALGLGYDLVVDETRFRTVFFNGSVDRAGFIKHLVAFVAAVRF